MRQVTFNPPEGLSDEQLKFWQTWEARSRAEQAAVRKKFASSKSKVSFKSKIWKDLKDWLAEEVFEGKCAYCEGRYIATDHGDAEHFRPKGNVTVFDEKSGKKKKVSKHPGYYWLAYDWRNLVPACSKCNGSKSDQFPAKNHVHNPEADVTKLDKDEQPYLINPYFEDPNDHLAFNHLGIVRHKTAKGKATIRTLDLNRPKLIEERQYYIEMSNSDFEQALGPFILKKEPLSIALNKWVRKKARFSQALRGYFLQTLKSNDLLDNNVDL